LTHTAVAYVACTEGRGLSTSQEIGTGATLPQAAGVSLNVAYKRSQQENTVVALEIVKACLKLAEEGTSGTEQTSVRKYGQQTTQTIHRFEKKLPGIALDPQETLECGSADVGAPVICGDGIKIINTGFGTLKIRSLEKKGAHSEDFDVHNCVGEEIAPGDTCTMTVEFNPSASGQRTASLVIHQNIPKPDPGTPIQLEGTGNNGGQPQENTLAVTVLGSETGAVRINPPGIDCRSTCTPTFEAGADVTLTAQYDQGSGQTTWAGCDSMPDPDTCLVHLTENREEVTAQLSP
jgi:hypothetical protein